MPGFTESEMKKCFRGFCGTCNDPSEDQEESWFGKNMLFKERKTIVPGGITLDQLVQKGTVTCWVGGRETGTETETEHLQVAITFASKFSAKRMISEFPGFHWEVMNGTPRQAMSYCMKGESPKYVKDASKVVPGVSQCDTEWTFEEPGQNWDGKFGGKFPAGAGARGDLLELRDAIKEGTMTVDEIVMDNPHAYHTHGRTLEKIQSLAWRKLFRHKPTLGLWFSGPAGSGKSSRCKYWRIGDKPDSMDWRQREIDGDFDPAYTYIVPSSAMFGRNFWQGLTPEHKIVVFEEFRGNQKSFSELLALMSELPLMVDIKGTDGVPFLAELVMFNSVLTPSQTYSKVFAESQAGGGDSWDQWEQRVQEVELQSEQTFRAQTFKRMRLDTRADADGNYAYTENTDIQEVRDLSV
jgi:hypothetical protein